jgi:nucleoside-diphosphate-sugar epimerase
MDTSWKNWALTIGSATTATLIATGHEKVVVDAVTSAGALIVWILTADIL